MANYAYRSEPHPLNLALYARRDDKASIALALRALGEFHDHVNAKSLRWAESVEAVLKEHE
jgi:hypothetical protein